MLADSLRILFFITNLRRGGAERIALLLARAAREAGHEQRLVTLDSQCEYDDLLADYDLTVRSLRDEGAGGFLASLPALARRFGRLKRSFRPDVVQVFNVHPLLVAGLSGSPPVVYHLANSSAAHWDSRRLRVWPLAGLERLVLARRSVSGVACSIDARDAYARRFGRFSTRISVVENGVDVDAFESRAPITPGPGFPIIQCVGSLIPVKNFALAIRALARLRARGFMARLRLAGDGFERAALEALAQSEGVADAVEFQGLRRDLSASYADADLFWITSQAEGFGLVAVEAALSGIPIISTRAPGLRRVIRDGETGVLVALDDDAALAHETVQLWQDPPRLAALREAALVDARDRFDARRMAAGYFEHYRRLAARPAGG